MDRLMMSGNQNPLRNIEKILEDSQYTGEINFTARKLKCFPKNSSKYELRDTSKAELSRNQFAEVPEEVCLFPSLELLNLSHNLLRYLPPSLANLQELVELNVSHNLLSVFPVFLCQLVQLQVLSLNGNKINFIPEEIGQLTRLTLLDMSCNEVSHIPNQLGELDSLKVLNLRRNQLMELPICLSRLKLCRLDISSNRIAHIPCDFRKVTSLEEICVEGNPLVSPPAHLCLRGLVHVMKFLHKEANKHESRSNVMSAGSIQRRLKRSSSFSASSDGRHGGLDRNRSYNLGCGLSLLGRNVSADYSEKSSQGQTNNEGLMCAPLRRVIHDASTNITNTISVNNLNRNPQSANLPQQPNSSSAWTTANNKTTNSAATTDVLNNNNNSNNLINKSAPNDLTAGANSKSLSTQAETAAQQLELWINGLQQQQQNNSSAKNSKASSDWRTERHKTLDSADAITKELMRQKAESEAKKKKVEMLKNKLDAAKTESERNAIIHQYSMQMKLDSSSLNNIAGDKVLSQHSALFSPTSVAAAAVPQLSPTWSNANTLPRCASVKDVVDQSLAKQKMKLPVLKIPTFRKTFEDGGDVAKNNLKDSNKVTSQSRNARSNGTSSDSKGGSSLTKHEVVQSNGVKSNFAEKAQVEKMRKSIESLLKMSLPAEKLESSLRDGVILCHLVNHIRPRSVSCIHVSSQSAPILSIPKIRRNVDNFILACKRIGIDQSNICPASTIIEEFNSLVVAGTVNALVSHFNRETKT